MLAHPLDEKQKQSEEIRKQTEAWLAAGNQITQLEPTHPVLIGKQKTQAN